MRCLAEASCPDCGREYYVDMLSGMGILYPAVLERETSDVHYDSGAWFADHLQESYHSRSDDEVGFEVERRSDPKEAVLVNCLDVNYGHCLHKLLNIQYHLDETDHDTIVLVPSFLRWMVPDDVSVVWTVDLSLGACGEWNDWLASKIRTEVERMEACYLSFTFPQPHSSNFDIERFTGASPFPTDEWAQHVDPPTVTLVWRGGGSSGSVGRFWCSKPGTPGGGLRGYLNAAGAKLDVMAPARREQRRNFIATAKYLRAAHENLDIAVAGVGDPGPLPSWLDDRCVTSPTVEDERALCERYAGSNVVVGPHGSNMLLPSVHAGATVDIMPYAKWNNVTTDVLLRGGGERETLVRHRFLPAETSAATVARVVGSLLEGWPQNRLRLHHEWRQHGLSIETLEEVFDRERKLQSR